MLDPKDFPDWLVKKTCTDKRAYSKKKHAKHSIKHFKRAGQLVQKPYRCPFCDKWHLTTATGGFKEEAMEKHRLNKGVQDEFERC